MTDVMDQPQAATTVPPADSGTPTGATPAAPAAPPATAQPPAPDIAALQRWNTQLSQQNASLRAALGVGKDATDAEIQAAAARRNRKDDASPEVIAARAQMDEEWWDNQTQLYGDHAVHAREFKELVDAGADPRHLVAKFRQAVTIAATGSSATGTTPAPAPQPTGTSAPPARPASAVSGSEPPLTTPPPGNGAGEFENTGNLSGFFKRITGR